VNDFLVKRPSITFGNKFNVAAFVLRMPKSTLMIAASLCAQFDASLTENQNGERETGNTET